jgi:hypothetical protein
LTIVVNLSRAVEYGRSTNEPLIGLLTVVAHEVFHAAFGAYKDSSPQWQTWYAGHRRSFDAFIDLTQNEGIAYYLTLVQQSDGMLPRDWEEKIGSAFSTFNSSAEELLSPGTTGARASDIIRLSNSSGYWQNYGAITGMIIARQIDRTLGRAALSRTIVRGPYDFFGVYLDLMRQDNAIPALSPAVVSEISRLRP